METYTYSQARQNFSSVLDEALKESVVITRKGGQSFILTLKEKEKTQSPFEVPPVKTKILASDILSAINESR